MKAILTRLTNHEILTQKEAKSLLENLVVNPANEAQLASFLTVFMMRPIRVAELAGFRDALLELSSPLDFSDFETVDLCGTGGDGKNTFNISTLTSFVVAGAGYKVAKHGNYSVSSASGSSNVLEALGYQFTNDANILKKQLDAANICFLHAPLFHPAMKHFAPVRKSLGMKTFFNMLGPLVNPAKSQKQLVGVFNLEIARLYDLLLQATKTDYHIIYALDGYDEISLTGDFQVVSRSGIKIFNPQDLNLTALKPENIYGGESVGEATNIFKTIINGKGTNAQNSVVATNAAFAMQLFEPKTDFETLYEKSLQSLLSGAAKKSLEGILG